MLEGLAQHLDNLGFGTFDLAAGGDIFIDGMPDAQPSTVVMALFGYGGQPSTDFAKTDRRPAVQVRARGGSDPRDSRNRLLAVLAALDGTGRLDLPDGTVVVDIYAVQSEPTSLGTDANGRHEHVINLQVEYLG